jgi:acetyltransferase-like isoleucine patch superfamily enzyme
MWRGGMAVKIKNAVRRIKRAAGRALRFYNADEVQERIERLRRKGVKIGRDCMILAEEFSTEPYLVELGNHVGVSGGTIFLTHDGSIWMIRDKRPEVQHFGKITVGDNTYIGQNCIILPGSLIGSNCVIGAGTVVRGEIPDNSLVIGNPCKIIGQATIFLERMNASKNTFDSLKMSYDERKRMLQRHFDLCEDQG